MHSTFTYYLITKQVHTQEARQWNISRNVTFVSDDGIKLKLPEETLNQIAETQGILVKSLRDVQD